MKVEQNKVKSERGGADEVTVAVTSELERDASDADAVEIGVEMFRVATVPLPLIDRVAVATADLAVGPMTGT